MSGGRRSVAALLLGATVLASTAVEAGGGGRHGGHEHGHRHDHGSHHHETAKHAARTVRRATRMYRSVVEAEREGYGQFLTCTREPGVGAMGTHWVNGELVGDAVLDPRRPEAMVYETKSNGRLRLVAVEYVVFQDAWHAEHTEPPSMFGQQFHLVDAPNRYGLPSFYALHVWAWKTNPNGVFANWNPRVTCDHAEGAPI